MGSRQQANESFGEDNMINKGKKHEAFCGKVMTDRDLCMRMFWREMRKACVKEGLGRYTETRHVDEQGRTTVRYMVELNKSNPGNGLESVRTGNW